MLKFVKVISYKKRINCDSNELGLEISFAIGKNLRKEIPSKNYNTAHSR